jgi:hypothetical protein
MHRLTLRVKTYLNGAIGRFRISSIICAPIRFSKQAKQDKLVIVRWLGPPFTHCVPLQAVLAGSPFLPIVADLGGEISRHSSTRHTRSISRASAKRLSWRSMLSRAFRRAENDVVYNGAFVPLASSPPRPSETPLTGARPPTRQTVPTLTYIGQFNIRTLEDAIACAGASRTRRQSKRQSERRKTVAGNSESRGMQRISKPRGFYSLTCRSPLGPA